jgi:hypothetical protein
MRQLLISDLTAPAFTNGLLAPGAVCAVAKTPSGFSIIGTPGFTTYADSQEIMFVQGTAGGNIFSPLIDGKDIFSWAGQGYAAQTAQVSTIDFGAVAFTVAGTATIKFTEVNNGVEQFRRKSYVIPVTAGLSTANFAIAAAAVITADIAAGNVPWLATATSAGNTLIVTGTTFSLANNTELSSFGTSTEGIDGSNGADLVSITATASPSKGSGVADVLSEYELSLQGNRGFYNRLQQPNTPPSYIDRVTPSTYDLYSIQWLNPQVGQIKGVDNRRTLTIAMEDGAGVSQVQSDFELALNTYLASVPGAFNAVNI